jgi:hypothetical protein
MATIFLILLFVALFGIFKPFIAGSKRRHFAAAALAFFIAIGVTAPDPDKQPARDTTALTLAPKGPAKKVVPEKPIDHSIAINAFQSNVISSMKPCDKASQVLADVSVRISNGRNSIYDGYAAASATEDNCRNSWSAVSKLEPPASLPSAAHKKADETLERCEGAMLAKQMAAGKMAEIFDGNMRPSKVQEARELADGAQAGIFACAAGFFLIANESGVDIKQLKFDGSK